jgi:hypothetical protein
MSYLEAVRTALTNNAKSARKGPHYIEDPAQLAEAYKGVEQSLSGLDKKRSDDAINQLPLGMLKPGFEKKKGAEAADVSGVQRWQDQISAMMASNDPVLQQNALEQISSMNSKRSDIGKGPSSRQEYNLAKSEGYKGSYTDFLKLKSSSVNVNTGDKNIKASELRNYLVPGPNGTMVPPRAGITYDQLYATPGVVLKDEESPETSGKFAMLDSALENMDSVYENLYNKDGSINQDALFGSTVIDAVSGIPVVGAFTGKFARSYFEPEASLLQNALELGMQAITRTETGAAMASSEIANTKARFMPTTGDSPELIQQKLTAYRNFLETTTKMIRDRKKSHGTIPYYVIKKNVDDSFTKAKSESSGSAASREWKPGDGPSEGLFWIE